VSYLPQPSYSRLGFAFGHVTETVTAIIECIDFNEISNKHFVEASRKDLFESVDDSMYATSLTLLKKLIFISNCNVFWCKCLLFTFHF